MNANLFKSAEFSRRRYHNFATVLVVPLVLLVLFLFAFSFLAQKEITVQAVGTITPTQVIATIQSTSDNAVITNNLVDNETVEKGQLLLTYSKTMESSQKEALSKQLETYKRQTASLDVLKASLNQDNNLFTGEDEFGYINTYRNFNSQVEDIKQGINKTNSDISNQITANGQTMAALDSQLDSIQQKINAYREIKTAVENNKTSISNTNPFQAEFKSYLSQDQEGTGKNQYLAQLDEKISSMEDSIATLRTQQASSKVTSAYDTSLSSKVETLRAQFLQNASQQSNDIQVKITELESQLAQADNILANTQIIAPENGVIHLNAGYKGKNLLPKGVEIAQVYPPIVANQDVLITYYVPSNYITLLKKGQLARMQFEKVGKKSLVLTGTIDSVAHSATETKQGNLFKVTAKVKLDKNTSAIKYGLEGRVTSVVAKKSFFAYYKDKILNNVE
ncbi:bacteriocin secretion accessory protein [Streptococcus massiliensis]|uniref:Putative bacteriocin secretion accessory protein n=1 Tax=Streptococcus massiliensis TaxID=313439 RepID=A0A380KZM5_9STRE|nr:bacteriocin secretion accessory protein [Streptococcus massiliensis]SUN72181.1 putative bacteriocin secretion accessory protein [Streptococcus massiliensis]SUN77011.1 putative bacteriocin secretion accessory protein [Streptococcus massiliensis]